MKKIHRLFLIFLHFAACSSSEFFPVSGIFRAVTRPTRPPQAREVVLTEPPTSLSKKSSLNECASAVARAPGPSTRNSAVVHVR